jgi:hypothetical protein
MASYLRAFFPAVLLVFGTGTTHAATFYAGVKAGLGMSGFWGADAGDSASMTGSLRAGFCGGAVGTALLSDNIGVQAEVLYAQKGKTAKGGSSAVAIIEEWKSDYLEVPLLCRLGFPLKDSRVLIYAGPSLSYLLASNYRVATQSTVWGNTANTTDVKSGSNVFDVGLAGGGGMEFDIPTGEVIFDVRFTPGFVTTCRETDLGTQTNVGRRDVKNYLITFMIGYAFKF